MIDEHSKKTINAASWYIISNFISKILLYIFTPVYTRLLSTAEYGQYNNFLSWQGILVTLLSFDLSASVTIAYYDYSNEKEFSSFVNTVSVFSYIIPLLFCLIILIFNSFFCQVFSMSYKLLLLLLIYISFNNTINIFQADQRVRLKYKTSSLLTIVSSFGTMVLTVSFAFVFEDKLFGVLLGGILLNGVISLGIAIKLWCDSKTIGLPFLWYALRIAVPLIPHVLAGTILASSDKVMITRFCGEEQTAFYGLAFTISMVITMIASSINKAWCPWFFDRLKNQEMKFVKKTTNMIVFSIGLISFISCLLSYEILFIFGGSSYTHTTMVMPPIIASCLVNCVTTFYVNIEFYNKKTMGISAITIIVALMNLLLNYYFIRKYGYLAAAYTTLLCSILSMVLHMIMTVKQNMWETFDNRKLILITMVFCGLSESTILLNKYPTIKYSILSIIFIFVLFITYRKRLMIKTFFSMLFH